VTAGHFVADGQAVYTTVLPALGAGTLAALAWSAMRGAPAIGSDTGLTVGAALYTGGLLLFAPLLRAEPDGRDWLFLLFVGVFATDICAYAVGRTIGRHKMAPSVSPGKTWEGVVGGLAGALAGVGIAAWGFDLGLAVWQALVLGALVAVVGQAGDLFESKLKRVAGVKDSGRLMPGHGGLLDRLDSILFNLPMLYLFLLWAT
jgi:phosphatidate cytidylyltransferase